MHYPEIDYDLKDARIGLLQKQLKAARNGQAIYEQLYLDEVERNQKLKKQIKKLKAKV